jgi:hypothetical protein
MKPPTFRIGDSDLQLVGAPSEWGDAIRHEAAQQGKTCFVALDNRVDDTFVIVTVDGERHELMWADFPG